MREPGLRTVQQASCRERGDGDAAEVGHAHPCFGEHPLHQRQQLLGMSPAVLDHADGSVLHSQLVPEIGTEPDYDAAVAALG